MTSAKGKCPMLQASQPDAQKFKDRSVEISLDYWSEFFIHFIKFQLHKCQDCKQSLLFRRPCKNKNNKRNKKRWMLASRAELWEWAHGKWGPYVHLAPWIPRGELKYLSLLFFFSSEFLGLFRRTSPKRRAARNLTSRTRVFLSIVVVLASRSTDALQSRGYWRCP